MTWLVIMKLYLVKIALRGISPMVWRRLRIPGTVSLATLHKIIQLVFNWDNEYLHQFHIYGKDYGIWYDGGPGFDDDAHKVYLDDFKFDSGDKFTYEYNFFEHNIHDIRIEKIIESTNKAKNQVFCISGAGMPGITSSDITDLKVKLITAIAKIPTIKPSGEQQFINHLRKLIEQLHAIEFNRKIINLSLSIIRV